MYYVSKLQWWDNFEIREVFFVSSLWLYIIIKKLHYSYPQMEKIFQQLQHLLSIKEPAQQFPDGMEKQAMKFIAFATTMSRENENLLVVVERR